jgi:hypothetical protein
MADKRRTMRWVFLGGGGAIVAAAATFLAFQGLEDADKWASVLSFFVGFAGLVVAVFGLLPEKRPAPAQSVTGSTIGGGVTQVHGVRGNLRIGSPPAAPRASGPDDARPPRPASETTGRQSVAGSDVKGSLNQISEVGGDAEVNP